MLLKDIVDYLEFKIPLGFQENYDNSGLQVGLLNKEIHSALLTLDVTEDIVDEAIEKRCDLIISHHPLIFKSLKSLTGKNHVERTVMKALKNDIAIYSAHTNFDAIDFGVSRVMADKLKLNNIEVLDPLPNRLCKLVTFIPVLHFEQVSSAIFEAGAGSIGNYDNCGYAVEGVGSFRAFGDEVHPFVGNVGELHFENEKRFETVFFKEQKRNVLKALFENHPYEEIAYDIYPLENDNINIGFGCIGSLDKSMNEADFLQFVAEVFDAKGVRYSSLTGKTVSKVAVCGGSGIEFLSKAIQAGADAFVTADVKYHNFFDVDGRLLLTDIGHFESEKCSIEILHALLIKKFPNFAVLFSGLNLNPINYL